MWGAHLVEILYTANTVTSQGLINMFVGFWFNCEELIFVCFFNISLVMVCFLFLSLSSLSSRFWLFLFCFLSWAINFRSIPINSHAVPHLSQKPDQYIFYWEKSVFWKKKIKFKFKFQNKFPFFFMEQLWLTK